jgi:hypothetical protein
LHEFASEPLLADARRVQELCEDAGWRFCFIGGLAVQRWGEPRLTRDLDVMVLVGFGDLGPHVDRFLGQFESREPAMLG